MRIMTFSTEVCGAKGGELKRKLNCVLFAAILALDSLLIWFRITPSQKRNGGSCSLMEINLREAGDLLILLPYEHF